MYTHSLIIESQYFLPDGCDLHVKVHLYHYSLYVIKYFSMYGVFYNTSMIFISAIPGGEKTEDKILQLVFETKTHLVRIDKPELIKNAQWPPVLT